MKDGLKQKTPSNIKSGISQQPLVGSSQNSNLKFIRPTQTCQVPYCKGFKGQTSTNISEGKNEYKIKQSKVNKTIFLYK